MAEGGGLKEVRVPDVRAYLDYVLKCAREGRPQRASLAHGLVLRRGGELDRLVPPPAVLEELHASGKVRMQDRCGRPLCTAVVCAAGGDRGLAYDRLGYGLAVVHLAGRARYVWFPPSAPSAGNRGLSSVHPPFENAVLPTAGAEAWPGCHVAVCEAGDVLLLPPYSYYSATYEGPFNVTVDAPACLDRHCWASAARTPAGARDLAGALGGQALVAYALPRLLPDGPRPAAMRLMMDTMLPGPAAAAVMGSRLAPNGGTRAAEGAAAASVGSPTVEGMVLEACAATELALAGDPAKTMCAVAVLMQQVHECGGLQDAVTAVGHLREAVAAAEPFAGDAAALAEAAEAGVAEAAVVLGEEVSPEAAAAVRAAAEALQPQRGRGPRGGRRGGKGRR